MTEERKQEIMTLIKKDETENITEEEAKEFLATLTPEEEETIFKINSENMERRSLKVMQEHENRLFDGYHEKLFYIHRLERLFKEDAPHEQVYKECKEFVLNFLIEKEPVSINTDLDTFLECPSCSCNLGRLQPFCVNCGQAVKWDA